jgi:hypothetical protein
MRVKNVGVCPQPNLTCAQNSLERAPKKLVNSAKQDGLKQKKQKILKNIQIKKKQKKTLNNEKTARGEAATQQRVFKKRRIECSVRNKLAPHLGSAGQKRQPSNWRG